MTFVRIGLRKILGNDLSWDTVTDQALPGREVTHFHFLRHGKVETGGQRLAYGHTDLPLSEEGLRQTFEIVAQLIEQFPDIRGVLSSDLQRARAIAEPLADRLGVELVVDSALREQNMGKWEGRPWSELTAHHVDEVRHFWTEYHQVAPPGGESLQDLSRRVLQFFSSRDEVLAGGRYVVVAHIGVIRAVLCHALDVGLDEALRFAPLPSTHTWIMKAESGFVVQTMGERTVAVKTGAAEEARVEGVAPVIVRDRPLRLALSGSAGVGKSTLGQAVAEALGVEYIPEGMRNRLEKGLNIRGLSHSEMQALVEELWVEQTEKEDELIAAGRGFVADRSPIDFLAFWMNYGFVHDAAASSVFFKKVENRIALFDRIVLLPFGLLPLQDDSVRSINPWIQRRFQSTVRGLLEEEVGAPRFVHLPNLVDLEERVRWCTDLVHRAGEFARRS
jgi:broad specificity phosphatase PhoE/nicotinamide riboside kinase